MMSVVVPIEEGRDPAWAIRHVIDLSREGAVRIHLLNVRTPLPSYVARYIAPEERRAFHFENGLQAMREAIARLDACGIAHEDHVLVGNKAETIVRFAREHGCSQIVVDRAPGGLLPGLGLGSIAAQIHHLVRPGDSCRILEGR